MLAMMAIALALAAANARRVLPLAALRTRGSFGQGRAASKKLYSVDSVPLQKAKRPLRRRPAKRPAAASAYAMRRFGTEQQCVLTNAATVTAATSAAAAAAAAREHRIIYYESNLPAKLFDVVYCSFF